MFDEIDMVLWCFVQALPCVTKKNRLFDQLFQSQFPQILGVIPIVSQLFGGEALFENNYDLWVFKFILIHPTVAVISYYYCIVIFISVAVLIIT